MKAPTRREVAAEDARQRILAAAAECLAREGLAQVRMATIARTAGVSSGLVHYHFDTKEQLLAEVLSYSTTVSETLTAEALERAGEHPAEQLSSFLDRCLPSDDSLAQSWLLWQELALLCMRQPELSRVSNRLYEQFYERGAQIICAGIDAGVFDLPEKEARRVSETAMSICDGLGTRVLSASTDLTLEQARTMVTTAVGHLVGHNGPLPHPSPGTPSP